MEQLHDVMRLPVIQASGNWRANAWCEGWIDNVEVEADMQVGRRRVDAAQDILHKVADAVLVHRPHVVASHAGGRDRLLFFLVNRAGPDDGDIRRQDGRERARA